MVNPIGRIAMIRKKIVGCVLIISFGFLCARDVQETILRGHKLYEQGEIKKALEQYNSIEKKGTATWQNIGNCHYKLGNHLDALISWKRAARTAPWRELPLIYGNIDRAYKTLEIEPASPVMHVVERFVQRTLSLFSLYGWQMLFLLAWALLLACVAYLARNGRYGMLSSLTVVVCVFAVALYIKYDLQMVEHGIVVEKDLIVYAGPDKALHEMGTLNRAQELVVCDQQEQWIKISATDLDGWVPADSIALI